MLGRAMMTARRHVVAHHPADRLRPFPVDIAFMGAGHQRQPLAARLAAALHPDARTVIARRDASLTIRIGAAVDRIVDHPVDGGVAGSAPGDIAVVVPRGQIKPMFVEPEERLARTAQFRDLVEDQRDRFLHTSVWVFLQSVTHLHEADGRGYDEFTTSGLLVACRERTLAQQIEFVLVETALEAEQQAIIALPWGIDCLLVDQHRVDDTAHLDELLPVAAVTGKARDLPGRDSSDLAEADLSHHPLEAGARHAARGRPSEIVVDRLDLAPAE